MGMLFGMCWILDIVTWWRQCPEPDCPHPMVLLSSKFLLAVHSKQTRDSLGPPPHHLSFWTLSSSPVLSNRNIMWKWSHSVMSDSLWPLDCSPPSSSVHGILQARILEWGAIYFSRESSRPRDWTQVSRIVGRRFTIWATREVHQESLLINTKA